MKADDDGVKYQDGEDDDPGRRLRQEGCQRLEETVDKKGEGKKMANELQAHRRRHGKSGEAAAPDFSSEILLKEHD